MAQGCGMVGPRERLVIVHAVPPEQGQRASLQLQPVESFAATNGAQVRLTPNSSHSPPRRHPHVTCPSPSSQGEQGALS